MKNNYLRSLTKQFIDNSTILIINRSFTFQLDYCNSLYCGLPESSLAHLRRVQNISVRLVACPRTSTHITPIFVKLH